MPRFRLKPEEVKAVAAFIWQSGVAATLPAQPAGDPAQGRESFETRGCLGCHSVGEGENLMGGTFAANLSRVGEKVNYEYLVRWIHNPRERSRPYCPYEKRDLTEEDYKKHGLPFVFDLDHTRCPNDGYELQVEQMTVMPSLRLSWQEARDIASYLMTLKQKEPSSYPQAAYLNDPAMKAKGKPVIQRYGCAGCHEIAGLEDEGRIGTELTKEGSKPLEQIDFGLFVRQARRQGWYNHRGFFEHKLQKPEMFDEGLLRAPGDELRMPDFNFQPQEITAMTTFLMGAVDTTLPRRYLHMPEDYRRDIQEGWWLIKKYNCMGCHQFKVGQAAALEGVPRYQTPEGKDQLPPKLLSEGARVSPDWLLKFLTNPALSEADVERNGVRQYLRVRMPTFYFSPNEVGKLVRFFQALSSQPLPYIPRKLEPLSSQEMLLARALFTSRAAPCLKCHATGEPAHDRFATAPNFLLARDRLKPGWTKRWLLDPSMISPGTAMPSGLFRREGDRWVFSGPTPPLFSGYAGDHADLLVRYMFEITPGEQRRLVGMSVGPLASGAGSRGTTNTSSFERQSSAMMAKGH
jgi:cytochrome c2